MAFYHRSGERKRMSHEFRRQEEEVIGSLCRLASRPISPKSLLEQEKRIRREIANSNERRRMQNINAGFQSLRTLLPHREGEKLSKAEILQSASDYIYQLEQEKTRLLEENCQIKRRVINSQNSQDSDGSCSDSPLLKRKKKHSIDEGIGCSSPSRSENIVDDLKKELIELRQALERERSLRLLLEDQVKSLESQLYIVESSVHGATDHTHLSHQNTSEETTSISTSVINTTVDNDFHSPHLPDQEVESFCDIPLREPSPEVPTANVSDESSVKDNSVSLPYVTELTISDLTSISAAHLSPLSLNSIPSPVEQSNAANHMEYKASTSRQNLETIVEAIRHLEGDHMFRDDPKPSDPHIVRLTESDNSAFEKEQSRHKIHVVTHPDFSFRRQFIQTGPMCQSRPGVIVSNHS